MKNRILRKISLMIVLVLATISMGSYPLISSGTEYPVKLDSNKLYTDDITGMWYPYTTDGTFNQSTDTLTITGFNGVGLFEGLVLNNNLEYVYKVNVNSPSSTGQVRLVFGGNSWQEHVALYISATSMTIYNLVGGIEQSDLGTVSYTRPVNVDFEVAIAVFDGKASIWINGTCYYDSVAVPTYAGTRLGAHGSGFSANNVVTVSNINIFYTQREAPLKSLKNYDYAADISSVWYPYSTDGVFDTIAEKLTITGFNGASKFQGLLLNNSIEYMYKADINAPSSTGQVRMIFKGNNWQEHVALYISSTNITIYDLVGGIEQSVIATANFTRPVDIDFEVAISTSSGKASIWVNEILYFDDVTIPSYTGACLGVYGAGFSSGNVITASNIDIFYVQQEAPEKPANNKDYAADITGMWYPYTNDGTFNQGTDTLTMTAYNGVGKFVGLNLDNRREYEYRSVINVPDSNGQVRLIFKGNNWQENVAVYISGTNMIIYDLVGGIEQSIIATANYTRPVNTNFEVIITTSSGKASIWIDGKIYIDEVTIPTYTGTCLGAYGYNFLSSNVTVSDIDIFYTLKEAPVKPVNNKDYTDTISGMWYPYTTDGTFNQSTDILTMTAYNGVGLFAGLSMDNSSEYAYQSDVSVPDSIGQVRFVFKGNTWQEHVALYISGTQMVIYDLVGGIEQSIVATANYTRPVTTAFKLTIVTSDGMVSVWVDGVRYFEDIAIPSYTGTCIGAYGYNFSSGNVTVSNIDIFNTSWKQSEFLVSAYTSYYHMNNQNPTAYFQTLKDANVNMALLLQQPTTADLISKMSACKAVQLKCMASDQTLFTGTTFVNRANMKSFMKEAVENEYLYGYYSMDEPGMLGSYDYLNNTNEKIKTYDTTRLMYTCLLPSYGPYKWSSPSGSRYDDYVDSYQSAVTPNLLASDYYPFSEYGQDVSFTNLEMWRDTGLLRARSIANNIPYWHVFQGISDYNYGYIGYMEPNRIKVQINTALAYGVKGVSYFIASDIILNSNGDPSIHYNAIKQINKETLNIGNLLFDASSTAVYHGGFTDATSDLNYLNHISDSPLLNSVSSNVIAGVFLGKDGKKYIAISNKSYTSSKICTVKLDNYHYIRSFNADTNAMALYSSSTKTITYILPAGGIKVYELT